MKKRYIELIIKLSAIAIMIAIDLLSKLYFQNYFEDGGQSLTLINNVLGVTYLKNTGAAFGMLGDNTLLLVIFTVAFLAIFIFLDIYYKNSNGWYIVGFSLIIGGAIGNFVDRIFLGYVRDFIELKFIDFPIFNFADIFLTLGVICYIVYLIFYELKPNKNKTENVTREE